MKIDLIKLINDINNEFMREAKMRECEVSELHIHNTLFLLYGIFYLKYNRELFDENFVVGVKIGPYEADFHDNKDCEKLKNVEVNERELKSIEYLLREYFIKNNTWLMMKELRSLDCVYEAKKLPKRKINKESLIKDFNEVEWLRMKK